MTFETIAFDLVDRVARITLNRPDRLNSFTRAMHAELADALDAAAEARVIVLTGAGRGFCAGQDLNDRAVAPGEAVDLGETVEASWNPLIRRLATMPQPVIARVNGVAAGAGANIALACDLVVAAKSAKFIQSFSALGLIPDSGRQLALAAPRRAAARARPRADRRAAPGRESRRMGPDLEMRRRRCARRRSRRARQETRRPAPARPRRDQVDHPHQPASRTLDEELDLQRDEMRRLGFTADYREGVAAFLEKRPATFHRRR